MVEKIKIVEDLADEILEDINEGILSRKLLVQTLKCVYSSAQADAIKELHTKLYGGKDE